MYIIFLQVISLKSFCTNAKGQLRKIEKTSDKKQRGVKKEIKTKLNQKETWNSLRTDISESADVKQTSQESPFPDTNYTVPS